MPAAAVIPAPIAYIKVVAVKTLVVEFRQGRPVYRWYDWMFRVSPLGNRYFIVPGNQVLL